MQPPFHSTKSRLSRSGRLQKTLKATYPSLFPPPNKLKPPAKRFQRRFLTVRSSMKPGTSRTPSLRSWPSASPLSWAPRPSKNSLLLLGAPQQTWKSPVATCSPLSISGCLPMQTSSSAWRTASKNTSRSTTTTAWRSSSATARNSANSRKSRFYSPVRSRYLTLSAPVNSKIMAWTRKWFL